MRSFSGRGIVTYAALLAFGTVAFAADEFKQVLAITAKSFKDTRAALAKTLKSGKFPPADPAKQLDSAQQEVAKVFLEQCDGRTRIAFRDASHWVDVKSLKDDRWRFGEAVTGTPEMPVGGQSFFRAEWLATKGAEAADVSVTVAELRKGEYLPTGREERSVKFQDGEVEVKNSDVAGVLKASSDAWIKLTPGAVATAPAQKSVGAADWIASASAPAEAERAAARREWYAWETPGVSWRVDGTTWIATVTYSATAATDAKALACAAALLKQIRPVLE